MTAYGFLQSETSDARDATLQKNRRAASWPVDSRYLISCRRGHAIRRSFDDGISPVRGCRHCRRLLLAAGVEMSPQRRRKHVVPPELPTPAGYQGDHWRPAHERSGPRVFV